MSKPTTTSRSTAKPNGSRTSQYAYDPSSTPSSSSIPKRPPAKPLGNSSALGKTKSNAGMGSGSGGFLTQAERGRLEAKEKKRAEEDCFEFLTDLRDVSLWASRVVSYQPLLRLRARNDCFRLAQYRATGIDRVIQSMTTEPSISPKRPGTTLRRSRSNSGKSSRITLTPSCSSKR
jgi:hypothetical protein